MQSNRRFLWAPKAAFESEDTVQLNGGSLEDIKKEFSLQESTETFLAYSARVGASVDIHSDGQTYQIVRVE